MLRKLLLSICCLLGFISPSFATHLAGGELRYEHIDSTNYRVYITFYTFCGEFSSGPSCPFYASNGCGQQLQGMVAQCTDSSTLTSMWCPALGISCNNYPYLKVYHYKSGVISLPPCSDWKIYTGASALHTGIVNIVNPQNYSMYLEAGLDNSTTPNSNPIIRNDPPYYLGINVQNTTSIQSTDNENDSIVHIFSQQGPVPQPNLLPVTDIVYNIAAPFTVDNPMDGYTVIDNDRQLLQINTDLQGKFYMYTRVNEYRGGNLIAYHTRAWTTTVGNYSGDPENPLPVAGSNFVYNAHPGQTRTITVNFADSIVTDSVIADFNPPTLPNVSFTTSSAPGIGSGSATVSVTIPLNYNLLDSPYINIPLHVHDNHCDVQGYAEHNVLIRVVHGNVDTLSVWPGDANADYMVNLYDPLAIAIADSFTGSPRVGANTNWVGQICTNWGNTFITGTNFKHADCNGDGIIDTSDMQAINLNYGQWHLKEGRKAAKNTALPDLYFDHAGLGFYAGATVSVPLHAGTASIPLSNLYGMATNIKIQGIMPPAAAAFDYTGSWLGVAANTLRFTKALANNNADWAYARTDHNNQAGQGKVAALSFTIPASANIGDRIILHLSGSKLIDNNGNEINHNAVDDTVYVADPLIFSSINSTGMVASIVPNPSKNGAILQVMSGNHSNEMILSITDIAGRTLHSERASTTVNKIGLPAMMPGIYFVHISTADGSAKQTLKWIQE